jgi:hypothetical protein
MTLLAPTAPGSIGRPVDPAAAQAYLLALDDWVRARRAQLDEIDAAALSAGRGSEIASDMTLSMAIWQAVSERQRLLVAAFDGGRVGPVEAQRLATLIWGRLDGDGLADGLGVSLPEACKLSDALAGQLRTRLSLVPGADAGAARIKDLRAQLERLRDQVALEPAGTRVTAAAGWDQLRTRIDDATQRAGRGGDVGGLLGPLEQDAARFERDLIVGNAQRRTARGEVLAARALREDLEAREAALTTLAATCTATVSPAPRYAVPDVQALGPVPTTPATIGPYRARLDRVAQALALAQQEYAAALDEHQRLGDQLDAYVAKARAHGLADDPDLVASAAQARAVLDRRPAPMTVARQLVTTYQTWLSQLTSQESA